MAAETALPLADIKVVEFSHAVMGPSAGMVLADLGADVIKVEPPGGDPGPDAGPFLGGRVDRHLGVDEGDPPVGDLGGEDPDHDRQLVDGHHTAAQSCR